MRDERTLDTWIDGNGCLTELKLIGGQEVVVHHDDLPDKDVTVLRGIPVTTPVRTLIDCAPEVSAEELTRMTRNCLDRRLCTVAEAYARIDEPDMRDRRGAILLRETLDRLHGR